MDSDNILQGYTYKEGIPLSYLARNDLSKPYNEARKNIEAISWGTFACGKTFPRNAIKTSQGEIAPPHPQEGYLTQYTLYEIRDWNGTVNHKNFPGERVLNTGALLIHTMPWLPWWLRGKESA